MFNNKYINWLIAFFLIFPFSFIGFDNIYFNAIDFRLYFWLMALYCYIHYVISKFIINNDFDDVKCSNCWVVHCEYDNYCFACWKKNII